MIKINQSAGTIIDNACESAAKVARTSLPKQAHPTGRWFAFHVRDESAEMVVQRDTPHGDDPSTWETERDFIGHARACTGRRPLVYGVVVDGGTGVCFDFNGVNVWHEATDLPVSDIAQALHTQWSEKTEAARVAYWTPKRKAEQAEQEAAAKRRDEQRTALIKAATTAHPFELSATEVDRPLTDPGSYASYKTKNSQDGYSRGVVNYAEAWAALMSEAIASGSSVAEAADATRDTADVGGITGFMYGCAVSALANFWVHGEALRRWHNGDVQIGDEGDKANESGGVLNPALLSVG